MSWLSGYTHRKKITIDKDKVDSNLTDFPVRVKLDADADIGAISNSDGFDIRFTSSDGTTLLKYEREDFEIDAGNASGNFWVKVPSVSSSADTEIYIYYRETDTADGADPTNVWDSNFKARYSMKDLTTSTVEDSTVNGHDGSKKGAGEPAEANAKIGKGQDFDGVDDYVEVSDHDDFTMASGFTIELLVKKSDTGKGVIISKDDTDQETWRFFYKPTDTRANITIKDNTDGGSIGRSAESINIHDGNWHHLCIHYDGGTTNSSVRIYLDNVQEDDADYGSGGTFTSIRNTTSPVSICNWPLISDYEFQALIDEVRISNTDRSDAWRKATYNSNFNTLLSLGAEEEDTETATLSAVGAGITAVNKKMPIVFYPVGAGTTSIIRKIYSEIITVGAGIAETEALKTILTTLTAIGTGTTEIVKLSKKGIQAIGAGTTEITKKGIKTLSVAGAGVVSITKKLYSTITATGAGIASIGTFKTKVVLMEALSAGRTSIDKLMQKTQSVVGSGITSVEKFIVKELNAIGAGVVVIERARKKVLEATAKAVTTITKLPAVTITAIGKAIVKIIIPDKYIYRTKYEKQSDDYTSKYEKQDDDYKNKYKSYEN